MAISIINGWVYALRQLEELVGVPLTIGTTADTAMAGNKVPTATQRGGVLLQTAITNSAAAPTQAEFNALLDKLRSAGIIAAS